MREVTQEPPQTVTLELSFEEIAEIESALFEHDPADAERTRPNEQIWSAFKQLTNDKGITRHEREFNRR